MQTIILLVSFFFIPFLQADILEYGDENICKIHAEAVTIECESNESYTKKDCYIDKMEKQDLYNNVDFLIDTDGAVVCYHPKQIEFSLDDSLDL